MCSAMSSLASPSFYLVELPSLSFMSIFISNDLDTDIETHDNSHLIPTLKLHRKVIHLCIHMVLNKLNQVLVENYLHSSSSFPLAFPVIWGRRYGC